VYQPVYLEVLHAARAHIFKLHGLRIYLPVEGELALTFLNQ